MSPVAAWRWYGFTVPSRGLTPLGSGNHTIVFGEDYIELLGILNKTENKQPTVGLPERGEGIERTAAGVMKARGLLGPGPLPFGRAL